MAVSLKGVHLTSRSNIISTPSFFVSEKGLAHIYNKAMYYFPGFFCILGELRLPTEIRKVKFTDFVKRATSPKERLEDILL